ncbi:hypothetical protein KCU99_g4722, partial [Aureobasidium melanogenum]
MIYMNVTPHFVDGNVSTLAFQFLAKFLELLAQASLGSAVFAYLRAIWTDKEPIPFGALFAGLQISSVNYLWSLEFAGVVTCKWFRLTRKLLFLFLIPLSIILAVGIGPSIAIALTPTPGNFPSGWFEAWMNATEEQLFPSVINQTARVYDFSSNCSSGDCARYGYESAIEMAKFYQRSNSGYQLHQGSLALTQDTEPNRMIRCNTSTGYYVYDYVSATASLPSKVIAWSLSKMAQQSYRLSGHDSASGKNFTLETRQPIVTANCTRADWLSPISLHMNMLEYGYNLTSESLRQLSFTDSFEWVFVEHNDSFFQGAPYLKPSVWAVIQHSRNYTTVCAIHGSYGHVQNSISISSQVAYGGGSNGLIDSQAIIEYEKRISIKLLPSWVTRNLPPLSTLLNEGLTEIYLSTFLATSLAISLGQWPKQILHYPVEDPNSFSYLFEPDAGILVGNSGLDNRLFTGSFGIDSSPKNVLYPGSQIAEAQGNYRLRMNITAQGYGYFIDQPTKAIAISVLAAYCLYIMVFVVLALTVNRTHSSAWDSIGELTALAIMSRPDDKLRNTSAGIETVALFRLPTNIRAVDDNHLEILFGEDEGGPKSAVVEKDKEYE